MRTIAIGSLWLRVRLSLLRAGPLALGTGVLLLALAGGLAWLLLALPRLEHERALLEAHAVQVAKPGAATRAPVAAAAPALDNLDAFHAALGRRGDAEQQLKTLFALAARNGLVLSQGEYKSAWDRNARVHTYQVNLPVKGSYAAIWRFALAALRAIPFAALNDISFRRDNIGDPSVEARLRLTLYLADQGADGNGGAP